MAAKIRKGDRVIVLSGRDKGKKGEVLRVYPDEGRAVVSGISMVKRHQRQTTTQQAGIVSKEGRIHLSKLAHIDPKSGGPTRVGFKLLENGKRVRVARKSGEDLTNG